VALLALALPSSALAGFGATANLTGLSDGTGWAPSIDYRSKGFHLQVQALDLIGGLPNDTLNLGVGFQMIAAKREIAQEVEGTVMPGGRARYYSITGDSGDALSKADLANGGFNLTGEVKMGMEMKKGMGFGIYVVPEVGVSNIPGIGAKADDQEITLIYGGGLEVSAWFLK
jgi:hypothetical protein